MPNNDHTLLSDNTNTNTNNLDNSNVSSMHNEAYDCMRQMSCHSPGQSGSDSSGGAGDITSLDFSTNALYSFENFNQNGNSQIGRRELRQGIQNNVFNNERVDDEAFRNAAIKFGINGDTADTIFDSLTPGRSDNEETLSARSAAKKLSSIVDSMYNDGQRGLDKNEFEQAFANFKTADEYENPPQVTDLSPVSQWIFDMWRDPNHPGDFNELTNLLLPPGEVGFSAPELTPETNSNPIINTEIKDLTAKPTIAEPPAIINVPPITDPVSEAPRTTSPSKSPAGAIDFFRADTQVAAPSDLSGNNAWANIGYTDAFGGSQVRLQLINRGDWTPQSVQQATKNEM